MTKKLFEVSIEVSAFVEAEDESSALEIGVAALREESENYYEDDLQISEVTHRNWPRDVAWNDSSLVYGTPSSGTTLGVWLSKLPPRTRKP